MDFADKILVIGVDAGTMELIRGWSDEGRLPNFRSFLEEGAYGKLNSVPNMCSAAAWSSMVTGVNPGKHGIFWFGQYEPHSYQYFYINASYRHGDTLWRMMSAVGKRVGIINVPISYPAEEVNGFLIAGIDAPGVDDEKFTYPQGLIAQLEGELGEYIIESGIPGFQKAGKLDEGIKRLHSTIDSRLAYASYLMKTYPWNFFMVVFTTVDAVQHFFWKYMRPEGFMVDEEEIRKYEHVIRDVYVHQDEAIGKLLKLAGPSTTVLIVSDHGGDIGGKSPLLPLWLEHMGMLRYKDGGHGRTSLRALTNELIFKLLASGYRQVDKRFGRNFKLRLARMFPGLRRKTEAHMHFSQIDWAATKAFTDGTRPDVWINVKGRFPQGTVEPGREYEEICEAIREQFLAIRDVRTGKRAAKRVLRKEEVYHGPYLDKAPDLVVQWEENLPVETLVLGNIRATDLQSRIRVKLVSGGSGMHGQYGIILAKGPQVKRGQDIGIAEMPDVTPTVLHLAGLSVPEYMDGRVVEEIFEEEFMAKHPVRRSEDLLGPTREQMPYSEEEKQIIGDRLRGMGYVE